MQIEGAITEVQLINNKDRDTGKPLAPSGLFKLHTKKPAQIIDIKVSPELVEKGVLDNLRKLESDPNGWGLKPALVNIEFYEGSNVVNQMTWKGFRLHSIETDIK